VVAVLASVAGFEWLEHRTQQLEFARVRARLEVQARELAATRGELERLSGLLALELAGLHGTETRVTTDTPATPALLRGAPQILPADLSAAPVPPTPAELQSLKTASALLQGALAAGRWTGVDSARFREQLASVAEEDKAALMTELTTAINTDKLRLDGAPAPF